MTSQINTNGINTDYPVPGENNSTQGFRDNFGSIRNNLDLAQEEITDLQNVVVVKTGLAGNPVIDNNMANTLIANAATAGFRSTTNNLGNNLDGLVLIDVTQADVHFGSVTANTTFQFGNWAPTGTRSDVILQVTFANRDASVILPSEVIVNNNDYGINLLENVEVLGSGVAVLTAPANTNTLSFRFSSLDCGTTISVEPIYRPFKSTQVQDRLVLPAGEQGDVTGGIAISDSIGQINVIETVHSDLQITPVDVTISDADIDNGLLTIYGTQPTANLTGHILSASGLADDTVFVTGPTTNEGVWNVSDDSITLGPNVQVTATTGITTLNNYTLTVGTVDGELLPGAELDVGSARYILETGTGNGNASIWTVRGDANPTANGQYSGNIDVTTDLLLTEFQDGAEQFYPDMPINFTGGASSNVIGGISPGTTYYVKSAETGNAFSVTTQPSGTTFPVSSDTGNMKGNPTSYLYVCTNNYDTNTTERSATVVSTARNAEDGTPNIITITGNQGSLPDWVDYVNSPVIIATEEGNDDVIPTGLAANTVYYLRSAVGNGALFDISLSRERFNGVAGASVPVETQTPTGNVLLTLFEGGDDIWKRVPLVDTTVALATRFLTVYEQLDVEGDLDVTGTITGTVSNSNIVVSGNNTADFADVNNLKIQGGPLGYYLQTDGTGNISWGVGGTFTGNGVPGGANTNIQFNDGSANFGAFAGFNFNSATNVLEVPNNAEIANTLTVGNIIVNDDLTIDGGFSSGSLSSETLAISANATFGGQVNLQDGVAMTGPNVDITSDVTFTGNVNLDGPVSLTTDFSGGNITAASLGSSGSLTVAGDATIGSDIISTSGNVELNTGLFIGSSDANVIASGTNQGSATEIGSSVNIVTDVTTGSGVRLPEAVAGMRLMIRNAGAVDLFVYPSDNAQIYTEVPLGAGNPYSQNRDTSLDFVCGVGGDDGTWYVVGQRTN